MKRSIRELSKAALHETDGDLGRIYDLFFDSQNWKIHYIIVDTGHWLPGRKVLLSPQALRQREKDRMGFSVPLTKNEVRHAPGMQTAKTRLRLQFDRLQRHYLWPWSPGNGSLFLSGPSGSVSPETFALQEAEKEITASEGPEDDPHLESIRKLLHYHVASKDGMFGYVDDIIIDDKSWVIHSLIVITRLTFPGKKVILTPRQIQEMDREEAFLYTNVDQETMMNSPDFKPLPL